MRCLFVARMLLVLKDLLSASRYFFSIPFYLTCFIFAQLDNPYDLFSSSHQFFPCKDASTSISRCAVQLHASARNSCLLQNEFKGDASSFETQFEAVADKLIGYSAVEVLSLCGLRKKDHSVFCRSRCGAATQAC